MLDCTAGGLIGGAIMMVSLVWPDIGPGVGLTVGVSLPVGGGPGCRTDVREGGRGSLGTVTLMGWATGKVGMCLTWVHGGAWASALPRPIGCRAPGPPGHAFGARGRAPRCVLRHWRSGKAGM